MRMLSLCFLLLFISCERQENITLNKPASTAAHLLPPDLNPAEAYVKLCSKAGFKVVSQELIDIFNNFDSTISSKRHYDHINFLDGITIGMGHWPQAEVNHFFGSLIKDSSAKANFLNEAVAAFKTLSKKECQKYLKGKSCNEAHIKSLISDTLFNIKFLKQKYGRNCRLNSQLNVPQELVYTMKFLGFRWLFLVLCVTKLLSNGGSSSLKRIFLNLLSKESSRKWFAK